TSLNLFRASLPAFSGSKKREPVAATGPSVVQEGNSALFGGWIWTFRPACVSGVTVEQAARVAHIDSTERLIFVVTLPSHRGGSAHSGWHGLAELARVDRSHHGARISALPSVFNVVHSCAPSGVATKKCSHSRQGGSKIFP
ncbi:MAG: hypothetical protein M0037_06455, partial [Betaproteobacteria bacterium]|nr:hypothetical protein [Betaproteobacteria bacterium]